MGYLDSAREEGATVLTGGSASGSSGYFVKPTVLVKHHGEYARGAGRGVWPGRSSPCRSMTWKRSSQLANASPFGLAASIWSNNLSQVHRLIPRLQAGTVWVNCHNMLDNNLPLGGCEEVRHGQRPGPRCGRKLHRTQERVHGRVSARTHSPQP